MKRQAILVIAMCVACCSSVAQEKDTRSPINKYQGAVFYGRTMCTLAARLRFSQAELGGELSDEDRKSGDYKTCITDQKKLVRTAYEGFSRTVKKPAARAALKEHYLTALDAISAIAPQSEERKLSYQQRQGAFDSKLEERWNRFEAEN